jgi:hypothetical protein
MDADIEGDDDLLGALEELGVSPDLIGAARRRRRGNKADKKYVLGMGSQVLGAAGAFALQQAPNLIFRPLRLVITETVANNFTVTSFKGGNVDQVIGVGGIPASVFGPLAVGTTLEGVTVPANTPLVLAGTGAAAATIAAAVIGYSQQ